MAEDLGRPSFVRGSAAESSTPRAAGVQDCRTKKQARVELPTPGGHTLAVCRLVESRNGAVAARFRNSPVSVPRSSNRTCGFPASGFWTDFVTCTRRDLSEAVASKPSTSQRQRRGKTAAFLWSAWWYVAGEGSIEPDRRRSGLQGIRPGHGPV